MTRIRRFDSADTEQVLLLDSISFAISYPPEQVDFYLRLVGERMLLAEDDEPGGPLVVGVTSSLDLTVSVPGGALITAPGITWVSVRPTHRRRGVLSTMIGHQLDEARDAGAEAAVLTASESGIYGRYGFGVATRAFKVGIDRNRARLREPLDRTAVFVATNDQARAVLPDLYEAQRAHVPGMITRSADWWDSHFQDPEWARGGLSQRQYLIHPEGYLSFRGQEGWDGGSPGESKIVVIDYQPGSPAAHAALWSVLLGLDLVGRIEVRLFSADDPLKNLLTSSREVRTVSDDDGMWLRPLHPDRLLAARTYALDVDAVIGVRDARYGDAAYRLTGGVDGAQCTRSDAEPDVVMDVAVLGSVSLGGVRLQHCAGVEGDPAVIRYLDRALLGDRMPNHTTGF